MKKAIIFWMTVIPLIGFSQNPLFIPDTLSGVSINLNLRNGQIEFYPGFTTNTIGVQSKYFRQNDNLRKRK